MKPPVRYKVKSPASSSPPGSHRKSRTRQEWIQWGLIDVPREYFPDWVYESLPPLGEFCEAEIQHGLNVIAVQERSLEIQLSNPRLSESRRSAFVNIQLSQLAPQRSLLLDSLHRAQGQSWIKQNGFCQVIKSILDLLDNTSSPEQVCAALDTIQSLFTDHNYQEGGVSVARLRTALRQTAKVDPVGVAHE